MLENVYAEMQKAASVASALVLFFLLTVLIFWPVYAQKWLNSNDVPIFSLCTAVLIYYCACTKLNSQHSCLPVLIFGLFTQN